MTAFFDLKRVRAQRKIPQSDYDRLAREVYREFPEDQMMYELHLLRALQHLPRSGTGD